MVNKPPLCQLKCPVCKEHFIVPGGADSIPNNLYALPQNSIRCVPRKGLAKPMCNPKKLKLTSVFKEVKEILTAS